MTHTEQVKDEMMKNTVGIVLFRCKAHGWKITAYDVKRICSHTTVRRKSKVTERYFMISLTFVFMQSADSKNIVQ